MMQSQGSKTYPRKHAATVGWRATTLRLLALCFLGLLAASAPAQTGTIWTKKAEALSWANSDRPYLWEYRGLLWSYACQVLSPGAQAQGAIWSSPDGVTWTKVKDAPPWSNGEICQPFVFKDKMWVMRKAYPDYWNSTDGKVWTKITMPPNRGVSWNPNSIFVFNNKVWQFDDVLPGIWNSDDGITWKLAAQWTSSPLSPYDFASVLVSNGKIWLLQGPYVWNSSDGTHWTRVTGSPEYSWRQTFAAAALNGKLWVMGGNNGSAYEGLADVWSSTDGAHWVRAMETAPWPPPLGGLDGPRNAAITFKNAIWLFSSKTPTVQGWKAPSTQVWLMGYLPGPPVIKPYASLTATAGLAFTSPAPVLSQATEPFTWTLLSGPAGMTVNAKTGAVTWPTPVFSAAGWPVKLRVANALGSSELNWWLTVVPRVPLAATVPTLTNKPQVTVTWKPVPGVTGYTVQYDDAPDFSSPLASASVSSATLAKTMDGLREDKTYWFHVLGIRQGQLITASPPLACVRDSRPPSGTMTALHQPFVDMALLSLTVQDPGSPAAGLHAMRFSRDGLTWTPWESYKASKALPVDRGGTLNIRTQIVDRAWNVLNLSTPVTVLAPTPQALYVDAANSAGPWTGTNDQPYRKIQDALNAAANGRTIIVAPGNYKENIIFKGKNVVLRSVAPQYPPIVKTTIIDGRTSGSVVSFGGTESAAARLEGFTITQGRSEYGAGINGNGTHAAIQNNRILYNRAYSSYSEPASGNVVHVYYSGFGGGIARCHGLIQNNIIAFNGATDFRIFAKPEAREGWPPTDPPTYEYHYKFLGSALYQCGGAIQNNTFFTHLTRSSEDIYGCLGALKNNILVGTRFDAATAPKISYSALPSTAGTGPGNIVVSDAGLVDPVYGDFSLKPTSPCIDAGCLTGATRDIDGEARGYNGSSQSRGDGSDFDIGADEYLPPSPAVWVLSPDGGTLKSGGTVAVHWKTDPARAGTLVSVELWRYGAKRALLGIGSSASGEQTLSVRLPQYVGNSFYIRVVSVKNPTLLAQTPPLTFSAQ